MLKLYFRSSDSLSLSSLDEGKEIEVIRVGNWDNSYKQFSIDEEILNDFVKNFNKNVLRLDKGEIPLDYSHEDHKKAAGWITGLRVDEGKRLLATVRWTPAGRKAIQDEEFRFISAEIDFLYEDQETGKRTKNVLLGAGLTNIPFVKGLTAVSLSETTKDFGVLREHLENNTFFTLLSNNDMKTFKVMLAALQEKENVTLSEAELLKKAHATLSEEEQQETAEAVEEVVENATDPEAQDPEENEETEKELSEAKEKIQKLSAENEALKKSAPNKADLVAAQKQLSEQQSEIDRMKLDARKRNTREELQKLADEGRILAKDIDDTVEMLCEQKEETANKMLSWMQKQPKKIDLAEHGSDSEVDASENTANASYRTFASEYRKENPNASSSTILDAFSEKHPEEAKNLS